MLPFIVCGGAGAGFPAGLQGAESQSHPAVMTQGQPGLQLVLGYPLGAAAAELVFRLAAGQTQSLISRRAKGPESPVPAAFKNASLAAKFAAARPASPLPGPARTAGAEQSSRAACSSGPNTRRTKAGPWGPASSFCTRFNLTQITAYSVQHPLPPPVCICGAWDSPAQECAFLRKCV